MTWDVNSWLVILGIIGHSCCEVLALEYVSRCGISLFLGSTEEVEGGDEFQAGFCLASVIHEPSRRRAGEGLRLGLCSLLPRALGLLLHQRTLLSIEVARLLLFVCGTFAARCTCRLSLGPGLPT